MQRRGSFSPGPRTVSLRGATGPPRPAGCLSPRSLRVLCRQWGRHGRLPLRPALRRQSTGGPAALRERPGLPSAVGVHGRAVARWRVGSPGSGRGSRRQRHRAGWGSHGRGGPAGRFPWDRGVPARCPRGSRPGRGGGGAAPPSRCCDTGGPISAHQLTRAPAPLPYMVRAVRGAPRASPYKGMILNTAPTLGRGRGRGRGLGAGGAGPRPPPRRARARRCRPTPPAPPKPPPVIKRNANEQRFTSNCFC